MARTTKPLTDTQVRQAKAKKKEYSLGDGKGLYLRVKPNGSKLWIFNYLKPYTKKRANIGLGQYPTLSLSFVRERRRKNLELLASNVDPSTFHKEQARVEGEAHQNTLKRTTLKWLEVKRSKVSKDHGDDIERSLELHIIPKLGDIPIHLIRANIVIEVLSPIASKGSLETVKRLCQRLNEVMSYSVNTGLIDTNPLIAISTAFESPTKNHLPTLAPHQLPELITNIANASIKRTTRCLIEWQLHTMTRPGEAAGTSWHEIDIERGLWAIPADRMKKNRAHTVPLTPQALALLDVMNPISAHREYVFPADRNPKTHTNEQTANMALRRMGYGGSLVAHGLRSLASTILNEQGFDPDVIETALAHADRDKVRSAYNRAEYLDRRRTMMAWWSNHIEEAATGNLSISHSVKHLRSVNPTSNYDG